MKSIAVLSGLGVSRGVTVTDQFCGAGGSTSGAKLAGADVVLAINHNPVAIAVHNANHPETAHDCVFIDKVSAGRYWPTDILITSPECTRHTNAAGISKNAQMDLFSDNAVDQAAIRSRGTMWGVVDYAERWRYKAIIVENVVEAAQWALFDTWLDAMHKLGYMHKTVWFNSMHAHPTPQSRDRMYVCFWSKGNRAPDLDFFPTAWCPRCERDVAAVQFFKNGKRWGKYKKQYVYCCPECSMPDKLTIVEPYYYAAANAIDWALPCPIIADRARLGMPALKQKTLDRIAVGLKKYAGRGFMADCVHTPRDDGRSMISSFIGPMRTVLSGQTQRIILPPDALITDTAFAYEDGQKNDRTRPVTEPLPTQTTAQSMALIMPYNGTAQADPIDEPLATVTGVQRHGLVTPPYILGYYTRGEDKAAVSAIDEALPTQSGQPRHYLVQPSRIPAVEECGYRMLKAHEAGRAMAFPVDYDMKGHSQRVQVGLYGQAVTPPVMELLMTRVMDSLR